MSLISTEKQRKEVMEVHLLDYASAHRSNIPPADLRSSSFFSAVPMFSWQFTSGKKSVCIYIYVYNICIYVKIYIYIYM